MTLQKYLQSGLILARAVYERRVPYFSRERLQAIQRRRLRHIVRHAHATVPFYREFMDREGLRPEDFQTVEDLARFPLIDRPLVSDNVTLFQSKSFDPKECVGMHSGTGRTTYWDQKSFLARLAYYERERVEWIRAGRLPLGHKQLYILPPASSVYTTRGAWDQKVKTPHFIVKRFFFDAMEPYEKLIETLDSLRPEMVFSYGSYLEHFARFLRDRSLRPIMPRVWSYGADLLSPHWREIIQKDHGCLVLSNYGTTEVARIGFECARQSGFHLNFDIVPLRIIRDDGSPAASGEIGEVVVSNLINRGTVLLNYRLGDLAELTEELCPCGRTLPLLRNLHGRVAEAVQVDDRTTISSTTLLGKFSKELETALNAQVVSLAPGSVRWRIVPSTGLDREWFKTRLLKRWKDVFGDQAVAEVEYVAAIPTTPAGKFRTVIHASESGTGTALDRCQPESTGSE
jgi:phenylacetate-CoA ligase